MNYETSKNGEKRCLFVLGRGFFVPFFFGDFLCFVVFFDRLLGFLCFVPFSFFLLVFCVLCFLFFFGGGGGGQGVLSQCCFAFLALAFVNEAAVVAAFCFLVLAFHGFSLFDCLYLFSAAPRYLGFECVCTYISK